jgi:cytidylate kinase
MVAAKLGFCHVDSGSLYRAATAAALRRSADADKWTEEDVRRAVGEITLHAAAGTVVPLLAGAELGEELRGADVTRHVSRVAQMPRIREWVNELVRSSADQHSVVVDGRDIGTVVFPNADLKIFLVADPWERARRRLLQRSGNTPSDEEIAAETERLVLRDARDATQTVQARDAVLIDTTHLTQETQVERIVALASVLRARK